MVNKLLKKVISLALAFAAILSLSCCGGGDEDIVLPDIVFVMYCHYPIKEEYLTGTFIGTSGYYIDKNGEIKYFEFEDETEPVFESEIVTIEEYSDLRNIKGLHEKLSDIGIDTEFKPIPQEDLIIYYKSLLKINKNTKLEINGSDIQIVLGLTYFYGVRINNSEEEYVLINESGDTFYLNDDKYAEKMYKQLLNIFPEISATHLTVRDDKLK